MPRRKFKLPSFSGIAAGYPATLDVPLGPTYDNIKLVCYGGATQNLTTILGDIRLKLNGNVQRVMDASLDLDALNKLNGSIFGCTNDAGSVSGMGATKPLILPIYFGEPFRKQYASQDALALGTKNLSSVSLEVDIKAGATSPVLRAIATVQDVSRDVAGIAKWVRSLHPVSGTGADITTIPVQKDAIQSISFYDPTGATITGVKITVNGVDLFERLKVEQDAELTDQGLTPVSGRFDVVFDENDVLSDALATGNVRDFRVHLDFSAAASGNMKSIIQRVGAPD